MPETAGNDLPDDLIRCLYSLDQWLIDPDIHLFNNVSQWTHVFETKAGEPSPEDIAPMKPLLRPGMTKEEFAVVRAAHPEGALRPLGLEAPSSFWPKFEHRFQPAEEIWFSEALLVAQRAGDAGLETISLFQAVLAARDQLAAALPPDGETPQTRAGGQVILTPMRALSKAMSEFHRHAQQHRPTPRRGWRAKREFRHQANLLRGGRGEWHEEGPHEELNY